MARHDALGLALRLQVFHLRPSGRNVGCCEPWVVDEIEVDVFYAELPKAASVRRKAMKISCNAHVFERVVDALLDAKPIAS
jgi:hypothetical protein